MVVESQALLKQTNASYQTLKETLPAVDGTWKRTEPRQKPDAATYLFKYIIFAQIFVYMEAGVVPALLLEFTEAFELTPQDQGLLGAIVYIALSLGSPLCGYLFRHYSPRIVLGSSLVLNNLFVLAFAFTPVGAWYSRALLIIFRGAIGFTQACLCVYAPLWVHDYAPKSQKASWMSYLQGAVPIGVTLGYLMGSVIVWVGQSYASCFSLFCWRWPFLAQVVIVMPLAVGVFFVPEAHIRMRVPRRQSIPFVAEALDEIDRKAEGDSDDSDNDNDTNSNWHNVGILLRTPVFTSVVLGLSALFFVVTGVQYWTTLFLTTNTSDSAYIIHLNYLIVSGSGPILGVFFGGKLVDYFGGYTGPRQEAKALKICMIMGFLGVVASLPISFLSNTYLIAILLWIMLFCGASLLPSCSGIVIACAPQPLRPLASSVANTSYNFLGYAASNYIPGLVMDFILSNTPAEFGWSCDEACTYRIGFRIVTWWTVFAFLCLTVGYVVAARKAKLATAPSSISP
ncbi:hypothetical protein H257_06163 [Aphanomyces astaci]|uniref:Major facilitator superfamily (MFS) profile domain-containing protein n=1 Tax=Aphanomyces astaci TaxID=112090 RepID=W4GMR7_APHAT|nr:hypothetical protein H257_06163 [Aphanomyces astaci]ETV80641.1 hypothetical protein H257_06163 [Aphanomyces astaci]RQM17560.1 hypothetical protein B5M09_008435 [Aphanomyces astaci]|eukprot:XP_009829588.1 hypothetical protein H257_06163 [Aphanomyces astaci]